VVAGEARGYYIGNNLVARSVVRVRETVIRPFGNSAGVTLPKETLEKYGLDKGTRIYVRETPDGILLSPYDPSFAEAMAAYREGAKKYRNAMRELSKR